MMRKMRKSLNLEKKIKKIKFHKDVGSLLSFLKNKSSENLSKTVDEWESQINAMLSKMYKNV